MFSIRIAAQDDRQPLRRSIRDEIIGKCLGFGAGLVLVVLIDALLLDHAIVRNTSEGLARGLPWLAYTLSKTWASLLGR